MLKQETINKCNPDQLLTYQIAMHVRNRMEDFHVKNLTDDQMKELNKTIRDAIYESILLLKDNTPAAVWMKDWILTMIPDYWELPSAKELEKNLAHIAKHPEVTEETSKDRKLGKGSK